MTIHSETLIEKHRSYVCLSSDVKPNANSVHPPESGDTLFERDTGRLFWWDGARWVWRPHGCGCIAKMTQAAVTRASENAGDATFEALDQFTIPGGLLGPNFRLMMQATWSFTSSADQKQLAARFGEQLLGVGSATTSVAASTQFQVWGANSMTAQKALNGTNWQSGGTSNELLDIALDMNEDQVVTFEARWGENLEGDTIVLEDWFALAIDVGYGS